MPSFPISYHCRAAQSGKFMRLIWRVTSFGMGLMFLMIYLGFPAWITVFIFLGVIYVLMDASLFKATYTLDENGIQEELAPSKNLFKALQTRRRIFKWSDIKSYLLDEDLTRYHGPQKFLKIKFHNTRYQFHISEGYQPTAKQEFENFSKVFLNQVSELQKKSSSIKTEVGFYKKPIAKILAVFFLLAAISLTVLGFVMPLGITGAFRLGVIIIPGTLYMVNRVFKKT
jgi:hypothetical protein